LKKASSQAAASCCSSCSPDRRQRRQLRPGSWHPDRPRALQAPIRQIADNAGVEGSIVVGKVLESKNINFGYDAQNDKYVDMVKAGIIDPAKVVRTALQDAASIASLMITTEAVSPMRRRRTGGGGMPDMGGMGGMGGMGRKSPHPWIQDHGIRAHTTGFIEEAALKPVDNEISRFS
jgi:hypothetical protein